ncbi:MAG TPA: HD domain-containing protein [Deinococcales bacterium]|nr:HD domain-containing protein [Deinococcales bacterium]
MNAADPEFRNRFLLALNFAADRHHAQSRKGTTDPYVTHPVAVAELLAHYHPDRPDLILAGLLHDTVEDTGARPEEIEARFGPEVRRLVEAVTKRDELPTWLERRVEMLERMERADRDELRLKLADCAVNASAMARDLRDIGDALWDRFNATREQTVWYYRSVLERAEPKLGAEPLVRELREALARLEAGGSGSPAEESIDWERLREHVIGQYPMRGTHTIHGPDHWARVERIGLRLAESCGADRTVVRLFALFHDSRRENDHRDDGHGWRGARLAESLRGKLFELDDARMRLLVQACEGHTDGQVSQDDTIGACWDSDRLDLMRASIYPDARFLSTAPARRQETIEWAVGLYQARE